MSTQVWTRYIVSYTEYRPTAFHWFCAKPSLSSTITPHTMSKLTHKQLENRLAALHLASLELVKEISLDSLLERIAQLACDQVDASYGAVGVVDDSGKLVKFIPVQNPPESSDHPGGHAARAGDDRRPGQ